MAQIDYYFGTISPYAYLAGDRLERIAARHGATIRYLPLDVPALFDRTGGTRPEHRHEARLAYRAQELARWSEALGMPLIAHSPAVRPNAAPSSYAIIAAQAAADRGAGGDVGALVRAVMAAHWAEGRDIAGDAVLRELLAGAGFDPGLVDSGLLLGAETYARNLEQAVQAGAFGSPFYIVAETDQRFWGQDRLDMLDRHLGTLA